MRSKNCYKCGKEKEHRSAPYCLECQRGYNKQNYERNKTSYVEKAKRNGARYRKEAIEWVLQYLMTHPCIDCGESDPIVLEFDHREGEKKLAAVSTLMTQMKASLKTIKAEIVKCDVRCANCHRRKTEKERGWYKIEAP
jgi:hypothetical protein